jgi:hypothetical protein
MGRPWWYPGYWKKQRGNMSIVVTVIGVVGLFLLYLSMTPVLLNTKNQQVFANWWGCMWNFGEFFDYVKILFVIVALFFVLRGVLGVILAPFKTFSATTYILFGGIAGLILLLVFWSGILNGSLGMQLKCAFFGGKTLGFAQLVIVDTPPPGLDFPIIVQFLNWGWLRIALIGFGVWTIGTAPFSEWWRRLT